jgi:hypothetical protein
MLSQLYNIFENNVHVSICGLILRWQHCSWKWHTFWLTQHFNYKMLIGPSWLDVGKSMDELHPPTCHVIWRCAIGIMIIFQLYYNQGSIGMCHVIKETHRIFNFWLLLNYIITNGTLTHVTWAFVVHHQIKLFDMAMCMVSKSWNYWFIENVNIWYCAMWTFMLHTCMTHGILLFVVHPTYVKSNQSKKINYMVVESKLKRCWK